MNMNINKDLRTLAQAVVDAANVWRLRERRRGVGWTLGDAARASGLAVSDVSALESGHAGGPHLARYAAALSAEEERRATVAAECCAECGYLFGALTGDDGPGDAPVVRSTGKPDTCTNCAPERPAPRFKVGEWVRHRESAGAWQVASFFEDSRGYVYCWNSHHSGFPEDVIVAAEVPGEPLPASPPAPEVVDVPQPVTIVKRCDTVTASWTPGKGHLTVRTMVRDMDVPIALLRAMLEAIDAQQGGAS